MVSSFPTSKMEVSETDSEEPGIVLRGLNNAGTTVAIITKHDIRTATLISKICQCCSMINYIA